MDSRTFYNRNPPSDSKSLTELCLVTYLPFPLVLDVVNAKVADGVVTHAYVAFHDKDDKTPHTHVYVRLSRDRKVGQVKNWFRGIDEKGNVCNTFAEYLKGSVADIKAYFTHRNAPDKYQYEDSVCREFGDIMTDNEGVDTCLSVFDDLIHGLPIRDLVRKYGKDFVYHYSSWRDILLDYAREQENLPVWTDPQTGENYKEIKKDALPFDV